MLQIDLIRQFLAKKVIAVVGVSRKGDIPANYIFKRFKDSGYQAFPINPNAEEIGGEKVFASLKDLPKKPEAVLLAGTPEVSEKTVTDCVEANVPIVWMHRGIGNGSYSESATNELLKNDIHVITNGCPMMFIPKVDIFHRIFRWFK